MPKSKIILCVDDEKNILSSLKRTLMPEGYEVITASSGPEGLDLLAQHKVDVVIADQRMPIMMGTEFLRKVKEQHPHIVRIMLSGYSDFNSLVSAINDGEIFRFISKPWNNEELKQCVYLALEEKKIIYSLEKLVKNFVTMSDIDKDFEVETYTDGGTIHLKVNEKGQVFSEAAVNDFLKFIFDSLGVEPNSGVNILSSMVAKQNGRVVLTIHVGKGIHLKVDVPDGSSTV